MSARPAFLLLAALLGLAVTAAVAEGLVRVVRPTPRVQIVRPYPHTGFEFVEQDGVTLWFDPLYGGGLTRGAPCQDGQPVVGVVGDSIFQAIEPAGDGHRFADQLDVRLGEAGVDACVRDGAWSGYVPQQVFAMLRRMNAEQPLDAVVVGVWKEDRRLQLIGDALYHVEAVARGPDGLPAPPLPVPAGLHRALFVRSHLWAYATLALAPPGQTGRAEDAAYVELLDWAEAHGVPVVLVEAAPMDRPLAESAAARGDTWMRRLQGEAARRGVPYVVLSEALQGEDVEDIRLDLCCHLNRRGHDAAASAVAPVVEGVLGGG